MRHLAEQVFRESRSCYFALTAFVMLISVSVGGCAYQTIDMSPDASYTTVLQSAFHLRSYYNTMLSFLDWLDGLVDMMELLGLGIGTLIVIVGRVRKSHSVPVPDKIGTRVRTSFLVGVFLAVVFGAHLIDLVYGTDTKRTAYARASVVTSCVIRASGTTSANADTNTHEGDGNAGAIRLWRALQQIQTSAILDVTGVQLGDYPGRDEQPEGDPSPAIKDTHVEAENENVQDGDDEQTDDASVSPIGSLYDECLTLLTKAFKEDR